MTNEILTASRLKAFRTCPRYHRYRYVDCREPLTPAQPMRFGTLMHSALEAWWRADSLSADDRLALALDVLDASENCALEPLDRVLAMELIRGYHFRWIDQPLRTLAVEHEFDVPLVNPESGRSSRTFTLRGKVDALAMDTRDKRQYLVEHKTTATHDISEGSLYWRRLRMDGQVSTYYSAFPDVAGCIYDVIRLSHHKPKTATPPLQRKYTHGKTCKTCKGKPWPVSRYSAQLEKPGPCPRCSGTGFEEPPHLYSTQRATDESPEEFGMRLREIIAATPHEFYQRGIVVRLESEIREHNIDMWQHADMMREMANLDIAPRNPDSCIQYNRPCDFFDVCTGVASITDDRLFRIRSQHAELAMRSEVANV